MRVNYDAKYNDRFNVNGEWAEIHNDSGADVPLSGWWFRDSALRRYMFQPGAVAPAGGSVRLRMGYGTDTADELHWGLDSPPFENPSYDDRRHRRRRLPVRPARQPAGLGHLQLGCSDR